jgi:hypothetical protein
MGPKRENAREIWVSRIAVSLLYVGHCVAMLVVMTCSVALVEALYLFVLRPDFGFASGFYTVYSALYFRENYILAGAEAPVPGKLEPITGN